MAGHILPSSEVGDAGHAPPSVLVVLAGEHGGDGRAVQVEIEVKLGAATVVRYEE